MALTEVLSVTGISRQLMTVSEWLMGILRQLNSWQILSCNVRLPPRRLLDENNRLSGNRFEFLAHLRKTPDSARRARIAYKSQRCYLIKIRIHVVAALLFLIGRIDRNLDLLLVVADVRNCGDSLIACEMLVFPRNYRETLRREIQPSHSLEAFHPKPAGQMYRLCSGW